MTTETAPDPIIHDWSNDLEAELVEADMEPPQAKAFARAFELGMTRVLSVVATKRELRDEIVALRQELRAEIAGLRQELKQEIKDSADRVRSEMRFLFLLLAGLNTALLSAILAIVA